MSINNTSHNLFLGYPPNSIFFQPKKKKPLKQCHFEQHCSPSSFAHADAGEEGVYSLVFSHFQGKKGFIPLFFPTFSISPHLPKP
jgi:hypothetical protein